jgi:outer membrane receptor protein involved in Fe transport
VTPIVVDTSQGFYSVDNPDPIIKGVVPLLETVNIDPGVDGVFGTTDDVIPQTPDLVFTNINYGEVELWGMDGSIFIFLNKNFSLDFTGSFLGQTGFYNFLTKDYDPINAPQYKLSTALTFMPEKGLNWSLNMRHIPTFKWAAGVHFGTIESYTVLDGGIGYNFQHEWRDSSIRTYSLLFNVSNINNHFHNEIIGGPELGRHFTLKLTARI